MKGHLYIFLFALAGVVSCSEELEVKPNTFNRLLTGKNSKTWAFHHYAITESGEITNNYGLGPCINDNRYTFYANPERSYIVTNGGIKCSADEGSVLISDSWFFTSATATLVIELDFFPYGKLPYVVSKLDDDDLVLELFFDEAGTGSYRFYFKAVDEE